MMEDNLLEKMGSPPQVFYRLNKTSGLKLSQAFALTEEEINFLKEYFLLITEMGIRLEGLKALQFWCERQKLPIEKIATEFIKTQKKYLQYFLEDGMIDGTEKLLKTKGFETVAIDQLFYCDVYAIEGFGKTKPGTLLHFAKRGQNRPLMQEIIFLTKRLVQLVEKNNIDAVGYIPAAIKRQLQIMSVLQKGYNLSLPHLNLLKVSGAIPVPQKALNKIEDRISNAKATIIVKDTRQFNTILLIDDAVGSGATINETAVKIKKKGVAKKVFGLAITGSFKEFDVIKEV